MKYVWLVLAFVFFVLFVATLITDKTWDSLHALWMVVCLCNYDIQDLRSKIR